MRIGDVLDTETVVYTYNCSEFICSNAGLDVRRSKNCQRNRSDCARRRLICLPLGKCVFLAWTPWSACRGPCGHKDRRGVQSRQRSPLNILTGSQICEPQKEYRSCRTAPCFGACLLSPWSKWNQCSKSCNLGVQIRSRYYLSLQPNCDDKLIEIRDCNPQCCPASASQSSSRIRGVNSLFSR